VEDDVTHRRGPLPLPPTGAEARGRDVPWGFLDAAGVFLLSLVLMMVVSPFLGALLDPELARGAFFPVSLALLGLSSVGWIAVRHPGHVAALVGRRPTAADLGMGLAHGALAFLAINLGFSVVLQGISAATGLELPEVQQGLREATQDGRIGLLVIASAVVVAPLAEETYFRGLLFRGLRSQAGVWPAIALSALIFGFAHYEAGNVQGSIYALVVLSSFGAYLAWVLHRRRCLATAVVMHATFNGLAVGGILLAG
jgi:membrane protease YdiL (CAAX protease family)